MSVVLRRLSRIPAPFICIALAVVTALPALCARYPEEGLTHPVRMMDETMMVPLRDLCEWAGATVEWSPDGIRISAGERSVTLQIGAKTMTTAGTTVSLPVSVQVIHDTAYMPVREVLQALGAEVTYDTDAREVTVSVGDRKTELSTRRAATKHQTALHWAAEWGYRAIAQKLIEDGANLNARDGSRRTPLHVAAESGAATVVELLITTGANVHARDEDKSTPLHLAARRWSEQVVTALVGAGASVEATDDCGWTPLHCAAGWGEAEIAEILINAGADVNRRDSCRGTPLHEAALMGNAKVAKVLIDHGAKVNVREFWGITPLHNAALNAHADVAKLLVDAKANVNPRTTARLKLFEKKEPTFSSGTTPLTMAIKLQHKDTADVLKKHGGRQ